MIYLVDESRIEAVQDAWVSEDTELRDHVCFINAGLDLISRLVVTHPHRDDDELVVFRLMIRCFNSAAASLRLARSGYYQPAMTMIRELVETAFLLDLFGRERESIDEWRSLTPKKREEKFKPVAVRKRLDELDGFKERRREAAYKLLSSYAAHASPEGFVVISPDTMTKVGPFPDKRRLTACIQELVKHFAYATAIISGHVRSADIAVLVVKQRFLSAAETWRTRYLK